MGNIFGQLGQGLANVGEAAVKASPYALRAVMQAKAEKDADLQRDLQQLYQRNADSRAEMASSLAYSNQLGNRELMDARVQALRNPQIGVQYIPDANGNLQAMPKKIGGAASAPSLPGPSVTPSSADPSQNPSQGVTAAGGIRPIATGVKVAPKAAPRIDPLSPQGVAAGADRAGKVAQATAQYRPAQTPTISVMPGANGAPAQGVVTHGPGVGSTMNLPSVNKAAPGGLGGSSSLSPEDRNRMLAQARIDNQTMKDYEASVLSGKANVGAVKGITGAMAQGGGGLAGNIASIVGNTAVGAMDPQYQKYITAQRSYGRIMGNLQSKRYTDHQAEIERSISGLQGNDLAGTIRYKQQLRDASLADSEGSGPPTGRGGAPAKKGNDYGIFGKPPGGDE